MKRGELGLYLVFLAIGFIIGYVFVNNSTIGGVTYKAGKDLYECSDGIDNDRDGLIDLADIGCDNAKDYTEYNLPLKNIACSDGIDNDGDGLIDFPVDPGCLSYDDADEVNQINNICAEDDDGLNIFKLGRTYGEEDGFRYGYTDFCKNSKVLREYYCVGNQVREKDVNCEDAVNTISSKAISGVSCANGVCLVG